MKVCLIEPPKFVSLTNLVSTIAMPPLGMAYIAGTLRQAGHTPHVIDAHGEGLEQYYPYKTMRLRGLSTEQIIARIPHDAEVIGIGLMFSALWPVVRDLMHAIREKFPHTPIILGGEHGTGAPHLSLQQAPVTAIVMGEGEGVVADVIKSLENRTPFSEIGGIAYVDNGQVRINPRRQRLEDIDAIAWPAWDLFDIERYIAINQPHGSSQGRFIPMLATRGCPFQCTFCTSPEMWTTQWIPRDPIKLVDEMHHYHEKFGVTDYQFEDLTAIVRKDWILKFCKELEERGLTDITFQLPSGTRSEVVDDDVAHALKKAGCHEFAFAPESGDNRVLKAIKKRVQLPRMYESARAAIRAGIHVGCFFILGFPEDDWKSVLRTYKAVMKCAWIGFTNVNLNAYSPQPNTESFNQLVKDGVITDQSDEYLMSLFTFQDFGAIKTSYNKRFSGFQISFLVLFGVLLFYSCYFLFRPGRIFQLAKELGGERASNKSIKMARSLLGDMKRILIQRFMPARATSIDSVHS